MEPPNLSSKSIFSGAGIYCMHLFDLHKKIRYTYENGKLCTKL